MRWSDQVRTTLDSNVYELSQTSRRQDQIAQHREDESHGGGGHDPQARLEEASVVRSIDNDPQRSQELSNICFDNTSFVTLHYSDFIYQLRWEPFRRLVFVHFNYSDFETLDVGNYSFPNGTLEQKNRLSFIPLLTLNIP